MESHYPQKRKQILPWKKLCCFDTIWKYELYNNGNIVTASKTKVGERTYIMLHHLSPFLSQVTLEKW